MKKVALGTAIILSMNFGSRVEASTLIGQNITYCTNSVYSGSVTLDPSACSDANTSAAGTTTITDPGVEFGLPSRNIDFTGTQLIIDYFVGNGSSSADLYIVTGLSGIAGLTLNGSDPLGVETVFSDSAIGFLVSGLPTGPGRTVFDISFLSSAVPEPATWAMFILGFGLVGASMRRRKGTTASLWFA